MPDPVLRNTFEETYADDYADSDNYYRMLYRSGRAIQQRELNQSQTIIGNNIKGVGNYVLRNGAAADGGQIDVNNQIQFVKLNTGTYSLPAESVILGEVFVEEISGIRVRIEKVEVAVDSDPATIYVSYIDAAGNASSSSPVLITPGRLLTGEDTATILQSQTVNTVENPAYGTGVLFTVSEGRFWLDGNMVYSATQNIVLSKYVNTYTGTVGFKITEDIVTTADNEQLFDNSGVNLNLSSPGADRYRVYFTIIDEADIVSGDYFIPLATIQSGRLFTDYNEAPKTVGTISKALETYRHEESGNYALRNFLVDFQTVADSDEFINVIVDAGAAYVEGRRVNFRQPISVKTNKPRNTKAFSNLASAASYGNYVVVDTLLGIPDINTLVPVNLRDAITYGGSTIGTARVRAIAEDGANYRLYLFDVQMVSGNNFSSVRSLGTSIVDYGDIKLDAGLAVIQDKQNNNVFFPLPKSRPQSISDIILTTQKVFTDTTDGSGNLAITADAGHVFDDVTAWITATDSSGTIETPGIALSVGNTQADFSSLPTSSAVTIAAMQQKSVGASKTKTLETSISEAALTPDADNVVTLDKADIYVLNSVVDDDTSIDITNRYILDTGQRDNFYDVGKLRLKGSAAAPSGNVTVNYDYFRHGTTGDFFSVNSYSGQVTYSNIPNYRKANGDTIALRDFLDFRPRKDDTGANFTGTNAGIFRLPANTDLINYDATIYLGTKGRILINKNGFVQVTQGDHNETPLYPDIPDLGVMEIANFHWYPYLLNDDDMSIDYVDNRRYTMRDIGAIEKRVDELEEVTSLTMLELETNSLLVVDSAGVNRLKSGITADGFVNHAFSDTTLTDYRASIDPVLNELRPQFHATPIELVYDSDNSVGTIRKNDIVMIDYDEVTWKTQPSASRAESVNPFALKKLVGSIVASPATDNWMDTTNLAAKIVKGDPTFDMSAEKTYRNWDFNWSGVPKSQLKNYKAGDTIGQKEVMGGAYTQEVNDGSAGYTRKGSSQFYVSSVSTVKESVGKYERNRYSIPFMRSRFISFKVEGLRANTQYFPFFDKVDVSSWINASSGTAAFVPVGDLSRSSVYLDTGNTYKDETGYPTALGGSTTIVTDANGAVSGYFLIPNTDAIRFTTGKKTLLLIDITAPNTENATSHAAMSFESTGVMREVQEEFLSVRTVQVARSTSTSPESVVSGQIPGLNSRVETDSPISEPSISGFADGAGQDCADGDPAGGGACVVDGGGDAGDPGSKVICTALYGMGELDAKIYELDLEYSRTVDPETRAGYLLWGRPVAELVKKRGLTYMIVKPLAKTWANQMAFDTSNGEYGSSTVPGRALRSIGEPLCRWIGHAVKSHKYNMQEG